MTIKYNVLGYEPPAFRTWVTCQPIDEGSRPSSIALTLNSHRKLFIFSLFGQPVLILLFNSLLSCFSTFSSRLNASSYSLYFKSVCDLKCIGWECFLYVHARAKKASNKWSWVFRIHTLLKDTSIINIIFSFIWFISNYKWY